MIGLTVTHINSLDEAAAYLDHPILGPRLRECTKLVVETAADRIDHIFKYPDNLKFWSRRDPF